MQRSINEVDAFLRQLNERKAELLTKYDKLKEEKMVQKSLALSTRNWDGGKYKNIIQYKFVETNMNDSIL